VKYEELLYKKKCILFLTQVNFTCKKLCTFKYVNIGLKPIAYFIIKFHKFQIMT